MNLESQEIIKYLVKSIISGKFAVGDILPTEVDLAKKFKTNRTNANYAFKLLEEQKIVSRKKRQGTILSRQPAMVEARKLLSPYCLQVDVMASLNNVHPSIHWNSVTLSNLENKINSYGYNISYHDFSKITTRDELAEYLEKRIGFESYALVLLPIQRIECSLILDNYDLFMKYHENVYLLDNGTMPVSEWPFHRVSQSPFLEGVCAAEYLIKSSEKKVVYHNDEGDKKIHFLKERRRGVIQGLKRSTNYQVEFEDWDVLDVEALKRDNPVIVVPYAGGAARIIDELKEYNMTAGKDYRIIALDNFVAYCDYNITCVAAPLEKYGLYLGELICQESFEKSLGNRISIEVAPYIVERKTFVSGNGNGNGK